MIYVSLSSSQAKYFPQLPGKKQGRVCPERDLGFPLALSLLWDFV